MFWVDTRLASGGVEVCGNRIVDVPPIWHGWRGRTWSSFRAYYKPIVVEIK